MEVEDASVGSSVGSSVADAEGDRSSAGADSYSYSFSCVAGELSGVDADKASAVLLRSAEAEVASLGSLAEGDEVSTAYVWSVVSTVGAGRKAEYTLDAGCLYLSTLAEVVEYASATPRSTSPGAAVVVGS